jgi:hypothetical protein
MVMKKLNKRSEKICTLQNVHKALILIDEDCYNEIYRAKSKGNKQRLLDFYFQKPSPSAAKQPSTSTTVVNKQQLPPLPLAIMLNATDHVSYILCERFFFFKMLVSIR